MNPIALLSVAETAARQATTVILQHRNAGFRIDWKSDSSPVTIADTMSQQAICDCLSSAFPDIPIVAEEDDRGHATIQPGLAWVVDPLDGTRGFAEGDDDFVVNIGLIRSGLPVLGVVAVPTTDEVFLAAEGLGAWKSLAGGVRSPIAVRLPPAQGVDVLASRHHRDDTELTDFLARRRVNSVSRMGSAIKACRIAEGGADLYPRFGPTMAWDTVAPQAILEAAGGSLCDMAGRPLRYGGAGWRNPPFVCSGRVA